MRNKTGGREQPPAVLFYGVGNGSVARKKSEYGSILSLSLSLSLSLTKAVKNCKSKVLNNPKSTNSAIKKNYTKLNRGRGFSSACAKDT